jgi:hypothetical protein
MGDFRPKQWKQRQFREALKKEIKQQGLIDTGALYESIDVNVTIDEFGVMTVDVYSVEYLKYLFYEYSLDNFLERGNFVSSSYKEWTEYKIAQNPTLDWKVTNPKIIIELND